MSHCTGAPADQYAEQYVGGTLHDTEALAFEDHYFDCPVCFAQLQALQAVARQIQLNPVKIPGRLLRWPAAAGGIGAVAALLLITVIGYRTLAHRRDVASNSMPASSVVQKTPSQSSFASGAVSQLADLALPPFEGASLRGEEINKNYSAGMKAYAAGNCSAAISDLARVPAESADIQTSRLYLGACQLKLDHLAEAASTLEQVSDKADSPEQEAAFYYLAQIDLLRTDPATARRNLNKVISLHGEFEDRAHDELKRISAASAGNH